MEAKQERTNEHFRCDLCENKVESLSKCNICDVYMCKSCTKIHTKLIKGHDVLVNQSGRVLPSTDNSICPFHSSEVHICYCKTCDTLICTECIIDNHSKHKFSKIENVAKDISAELSEKLKKFKSTHASAVISNIKKIENVESDNDIQGQLNTQRLKERVDALTCKISEIAEKYIQKSENSREQNKRYLNKIRESLENELAEIDNISTKYTDILTSGSDIDKIFAKSEASREMEKYKSSEEINVYLPKYVPDEDDAITAFERSINSIYNQSVQNDLDSSHGISRNKTVSKPNSSFDVKVISTFNHKSMNITSICPITNNTFLIHCYNEYSNDVVDCDGKTQGSLDLDFIGCDFAVKADCLIVANYNSRNISKFAKDGTKTDTISTAPLYPEGLCITRHEDILVALHDERSYDVTYGNKRRVTRITSTGKIIIDYEFYNGKRLFTLPIGLDENVNGDICVINKTNFDSGNLVVIDVTGDKKITYTGGPTDEHFDPVQVKCDKYGRMILSDKTNKKIHLLSSDGHLLTYLMTEMDFNYRPISISVDFQGLLWIGCTRGH